MPHLEAVARFLKQNNAPRSGGGKIPRRVPFSIPLPLNRHIGKVRK